MKQTISHRLVLQFSTSVMALLILFVFTSCNQGKAKTEQGNDDITAGKENTALTDSIAQKANAIAGKWETTTVLDDKIAFEFSQAQKEGDTYTGTYIFYVNDTKDAPAKYIVSGDKMIKFFNEVGKEYPLIKVSVSDNGDSLIYYDQKDGQKKLVKATFYLFEKYLT